MNKFSYKNLFTNISLFFASIITFFLILSLLASLFHVYGVSTNYFIWNPHINCYQTNNAIYIGAHRQFFSKKNNNTFRIFIFGGSSIHYLKDFALLKEMLNKEFPLIHFEIINVGVLSYGTNRLLPIVKEAAKYNPDLFIFYAGNNEFLEQFLQKNYCINLAAKMHARLLNFKEYVFLFKVIAKLSSRLSGKNIVFENKVHISWAYPLPEIERSKIYLNYGSNIKKIVNFAKSKNVDIIISTVPYNYVDDRYISPSYYSNSKNRQNTRYNTKQIAIQNISDAEILELAKWVKKDPYIENRLGKYYLKEQNYSKAIEFFINASKDDFQPVRANAITNGIVRNISRDMNVPLADVEKSVVQHSPHLIPDFSLFNDRCHLNTEGNRLMQIEFFNKIKDVINSSAKITRYSHYK